LAIGIGAKVAVVEFAVVELADVELAVVVSRLDWGGLGCEVGCGVGGAVKSAGSSVALRTPRLAALTMLAYLAS
jgi:hypothetical protein